MKNKARIVISVNLNCERNFEKPVEHSLRNY